MFFLYYGFPYHWYLLYKGVQMELTNATFTSTFMGVAWEGKHTLPLFTLTSKVQNLTEIVVYKFATGCLFMRIDMSFNLFGIFIFSPTATGLVTTTSDTVVSSPLPMPMMWSCSSHRFNILFCHLTGGLVRMYRRLVSAYKCPASFSDPPSQQCRQSQWLLGLVCIKSDLSLQKSSTLSS